MNVNGEFAMQDDLFREQRLAEQRSLSLLFGSKAKSRNTDASTSHKAGEKVDTARLEGLVYEAIKKYPDGCIMDDVIAALPSVREHSIQPRFAPLIRKGFVVDTGDKREGRSGRLQRIIKATDK
jgi:hypothetical protein